MINVAVVILSMNFRLGHSLAVQSGTELRLDASESELPDFSDYVQTFGRSYQQGTEEYNQWHAVFKQNMRLIQSQNSLPSRIWSAAVNHLTDRTDEELKQLLGWRRAEKMRAGMSLLSGGAQALPEPPEEVDWTHLKMSSEVPDQGGCGSCWAVATVSMLQGRYEVHMNGTRTFSAQQLVNCVPNPKECGGSGGCTGATVELAMDYIQKKGLQDSDAVSYEGKDGDCPAAMSMKTSSPVFLGVREDTGADFGLRRWQTLPENKLQPLMLAVTEGPVAVSVAADAWFHYGRGIFDGCGQDGVINHAVTLFGYGKDSKTNKKFWSVRNSWGHTWGENGFIRLLRRDNAEEEAYCGTDNDPSAGVACRPYPKSVRICGSCGILYDSVAASLGQTI